MTGDTIADLVYSDGTKTWNLFENWHFGERSNAVFVPLTNDVAGELPGASQEEQGISSDDFYEMFWEIDRDSMQAYLDEHPEALWNGWTGIDINESGLNSPARRSKRSSASRCWQSTTGRRFFWCMRKGRATAAFLPSRRFRHG